MPLVWMNYQMRHTRAAMYNSPGFHDCDWTCFMSDVTTRAPTGTKLPWISLCCWKTHKGTMQGALSTAKQPTKGSQTVCQILKEFSSLLSDIQKRLLCCRTLEGQGFFVEPKWPLPPPKSLQNTDLYVKTQQLHISLSADQYGWDTACFIYRLHWSPLWVECQHWPMKWTLTVDQKGFQWHIVPVEFRLN